VIAHTTNQSAHFSLKAGLGRAIAPSQQKSQRRTPGLYRFFFDVVCQCDEYDFQEPPLGVVGDAAIPQLGGAVAVCNIILPNLVRLPQKLPGLLGFNSFNGQRGGLVGNAAIGQIHGGTPSLFVQGLGCLGLVPDELIVPGLPVEVGDLWRAK